MSNQQKMLEVVDQNDKTIGLETRAKIHQDGLLHREIHVWFFTPQGEIIFQHRAKDKDTYPDKLDATIGGHVEPGMSYEETAIKECREETGVRVDPNKLIFLGKIKKKSFDMATGLTNNTVRSQYAYLYPDSLSNLQIEKGEALGFEAWRVEKLANLSEMDKNRFIPVSLEEDMLNLFNRAKKLLLK